MHGLEVFCGHVRVSLRCFQVRIAHDFLQAEHVPALAQIAGCERVPRCVQRARWSGKLGIPPAGSRSCPQNASSSNLTVLIMAARPYLVTDYSDRISSSRTMIECVAPQATDPVFGYVSLNGHVRVRQRPTAAWEVHSLGNESELPRN